MMSRNIRSEIFVAMMVIVGLTIAISFGVFLSSENPDDIDDPTTESGSTSNVGAVATVTEAFDASTPEITIDVTVSDTLELTSEGIVETLIVATTSQAIVTETDVAESGTEENSSLSDTPTSDRTAEVGVTIMSTNTATLTLTSHPTETNTQRPTRTIRPTITPSPTVTNTPTTTLTPSPTPTLTHTSYFTSTPSVLPTDRPTRTSSPLATNTAEVSLMVNSYGCSSPSGWSNYVVQVGNTLFSIAQAVGSTVSELQQTNCLPNANQIIVGDVLFVPELPAQPVRTNVPANPTNPSTNPNIAPNLMALGCSNPAVQIMSPVIGQQVSGMFSVTGTATYNDAFGYYLLEIRADNAVVYNFYSRSDAPVMGDILGQLDASLFSSGVYWLRLLVVDNTGNIRADATCVIPIVID